MSIEQADDSLLIARMKILLQRSFCTLSNAFTNANVMMHIQLELCCAV